MTTAGSPNRRRRLCERVGPWTVALAASTDRRSASQTVEMLMRTVLRVAPKQGRFLDGCTTQNMRWLLRTLGATHPDAMMAVEWSFNYRPDTSPLDSSWSIWGSEKPPYFPLERLGLEPQELEYADFNTAWASVRRSIDLGTPVLVGADEHLLPWVRENTSRIYSRYMHMFGIF